MKKLNEPDINIKVKNEQDTVIQIDKQDDREIRFEIESGQSSNHYVYMAKRAGGLQDYKIGIAGINHLARRRGGILSPIDKLIVKEDKASWDITIEILDSFSKSSAIGTYVQPKFDEFGNSDIYAKQICLSKARRNALVQLISDEEKQGLINEFIKQEKKLAAELKRAEERKNKKRKEAAKAKKQNAKTVKKVVKTKTKKQNVVQGELIPKK